ncbi:hypothetical protein DO021_06255 [Desulfobacter hydrogenophilus]|uniref:Contractile injection system tube protein N-terminal domain-containing protein n=1 Tax=Desulfobacter hydrogenophilus TaxID=2291 RepID=A0A328FG87_9BACT|nr:hypothetical protein [Desulfobacter hydrogenophilus]NDY71148.1 hypothetical protein [Desulfobacter hydrogenophilus]QBH14250.1 hypothetical protein EYB58_15805 [Desulfobacter hydrogenophilus]RAM02820.1 hypothetical protein DO021_06255 [Desulfobacter hydrogenophilus]
MPDTHPRPREELQTTAVFMPKTDENGQTLSDNEQRDNKVTVHFNPESLDITFTNSVQKGRRNQPAQVSVTETTAKLSMALIFDTTRDGADVRTRTNLLGRMMDPAQQRPRRNNRNRKIPSIVIFQWGTIWFEGYIDSYREKLDFFSSEGVPLRAVVTLSMTQQQRNFDPNTSVNPANNTAGDVTPGTNDPATRSGTPSGNSPVNRTGSNTSVTDTVASGNSMAAGNSTAARAVAAANGIENMRLPEVNELVLPNLQASARANVSLNAQAGISLKANSETAAQFGNLKQSVNASMGAGVSFDLESHFDTDFQLDANMSAGLDGGFSAKAEASMSADVGVSADIEPGITFED